MTTEATVYRVQMKMGHAFAHARAVRAESEVLVVVLDIDGVRGVGECVARNYVTGETVESVFRTLSSVDVAAIARQIEARSFGDAVAAIEALSLPTLLKNRGRIGLAASCALETALLDLSGKRFSVSIRELIEHLGLPEELRRSATNVQPLKVSKALDFATAPEALAKLVPLPQHVKIKGGDSDVKDLERVRAIREAFGEHTSISVDVNMAWHLEQAVKMTLRMRPYDVAWYEEPFTRYSWDDCQMLRRRTGARIMVDESLCTYTDAQTAISRRACDLFNIRISKCGGLIPSLRIAKLAFEHGIGIHLGVHPGQMGILGAANVQFLTGLAPPFVCEGRGAWFGTGGFVEKIIAEDLFLDPQTRECSGLLPTGLGVTVRVDVLERFATAKASYRDGSWERS